MELSLAICAGLWYWIARTQVGYTLHAILCQPLVMALPFGLIYGNLSQAMIIAASIQMVYLGLVGNGGNLPADECLAGCVAIPIALVSQMDPGQAVVLAMPFAMTIYIIGKKQYLPFFIIAFFMVQYLKINVMAAAIFGTCIALLIVLLRREKNMEGAI